MIGHRQKLVLAAMIFVLLDGSARVSPSSSQTSLIGIDHIPTLVADLNQADAAYRRLGFALKAGRVHLNGLRNQHLKFKDGSGIELLSVPANPTDELTKSYAQFLKQGEGPVYLSFHARNTESLVAALKTANMGLKNDNGLITLSDRRLSFIFFVRDNRSPSDKPEHFAHPNGAVAMSEVWLALDAATLVSLRKLLLALGSVERTERVEAPTHTQAQVFYLQNGRVIVLNQDHQLLPGRKIIGAGFRVLTSKAKKGGSGPSRQIVKPAQAHGLWLSLIQ